MEQNETIRRLLDMQEHPENYSEDQLRQILADDEMASLMEQLAQTKRAFIRRDMKEEDIPVDEEWEKIKVKHEGWRAKSKEKSKWRIMKIAAAFIGVLIISGITYAVINVVSHSEQHTQEAEETVAAVDASLPMQNASPSVAPNDTAQAIVFDNVTLDEMLPQIAAYYHKDVEFRNSDARQLRFYFVWRKHEPLDTLLRRLNRFESMSVELKDNKIIVE